MVTSSNNAESTNGSKDVLAAKRESGNSFGKKDSSKLPLDPAYTGLVDEDEHLIRKCDTFVGGKL